MKKGLAPRGYKSNPRSSLYKPTKTFTMASPKVTAHGLGRIGKKVR